MDTTEDRQGERILSEDNASGAETDKSAEQINIGSTDALGNLSTDVEETPKATWIHDQEISFKRMNNHLTILKEALEQCVEKHKQELVRIIGARDVIRK